MLRYKIIKKMLSELLSTYPEGAQVPSRTTLCERLDTSRMTLDKAMKELELEGYIYSIKGSGTYIGKEGRSNRRFEGGTWCVIVPDVQDTAFARLIRGVENIAQREKINMVLCNGDEDVDKQSMYIRRMIDSGVSGFIIVPVITRDIARNQNLYRYVIDSGIPMVFCHREVDGIAIPTIKTSDFYGGYMATKHLIERGYRNIAYIATTRFRISFERCQGYLCALMENGIPVNRKLICVPEKSEEKINVSEATEMLLDSADELDSIFCFNDNVAREVCETLKSRGRRISDDIGIIGYMNMPVCEEYTPKLTTVAYRMVEIGEMAAEVMLKIMYKLPLSGYDQYIFQPSLVVRNSCLGKHDS